MRLSSTEKYLQLLYPLSDVDKLEIINKLSASMLEEGRRDYASHESEVMTLNETSSADNISPVDALSGIIELPIDFDYKKELSDALNERYSL